MISTVFDRELCTYKNVRGPVDIYLRISMSSKVNSNINGTLEWVRKNFRSTKEIEPTVDELMNEEEKDPEIIPPGKQPLNQEHQVGVHVIDFEELKKE